VRLEKGNTLTYTYSEIVEDQRDAVWEVNMAQAPRALGEGAGDTEGSASSIPLEAYLVVDGVKVIPLTQAVVSIGRRIENTVVLDDPRVSRAHAQLRAINGRYVLFDLDSRGGCFINSVRVTQSILYPGDVISLAGVTLIYGQTNSPPRADLKETAPL
jgi:hypothetical protein